MKFIGAALLAVTIAAGEPLRLHPENPHYFLFEGKPAVLVGSSEHYGAVLNLEFNYVRYLDTLKENHLNLTRTFMGSYREVPGNFEIASNTLAPSLGKFIGPWAQRDGKFDLTKWDDAYFTRLKDFVLQAQQRGIVVEIVLFCPLYEESIWQASPMNARNNVNGIGTDIQRADVLTMRNPPLTQVQDAMARKVVSELRDFDNVYYEICNEPYAVGVTLEWQEHISKTIAAEEANYPKKHLIAQNWSNYSSVIDRPNPLVSLFNFHYSRPPESVGMNWALGRAIGNNENGFDGPADATYRIQGWDFLMAGGALYNNLDYSFTVGHEDGSFVPPPQTPGGGTAALRQQLGYLRRFFDQIPFWRMRPAAAGTVSGPQGASVRVLEAPGEVYAVYVHHGRILKDAKPQYQVDATAASRQLSLQLPPGAYTATWRDTRTGRDIETAMIQSAASGQWQTLTSPVYSEDIALIVRAENTQVR